VRDGWVILTVSTPTACRGLAARARRRVGEGGAGAVDPAAGPEPDVAWVRAGCLRAGFHADTAAVRVLGLTDMERLLSRGTA